MGLIRTKRKQSAPINFVTFQRCPKPYSFPLVGVTHLIQTLDRQDTVWGEILESISNYKKPNCPACRKGRLRFAGIVHPDPLPG